MPHLRMILCGLVLSGLALPASTAPAADFGRSSRVPVQTCLENAAALQAGDFVKLEYLDPSAEGVPTYEIEIRDAEDREWELMCDATTGAIYEIEREVDSADDPLFSRHAKIGEDEAHRAALALYPGRVVAVEYEIESNGDATYELDIVREDGSEMKIEVDAASGEIIEVAAARWQIGLEPEERR